jgi:RHH-type rel operon transcriptional repressor/antitoxin RelB
MTILLRSTKWFVILVNNIYTEVAIMVSVRLPKDVENRLNTLTDTTGRTKTYYVLEALLNYMEDIEDVYTALEVLEHPAKEWTQEELEYEIDLQG